jgi:hypothetical protein
VCGGRWRRSFDHLLGYLKARHPEIDGLRGDESNPYDPRRPELGNVTVSDDAVFVTDPDPGVRGRHAHTPIDREREIHTQRETDASRGSRQRPMPPKSLTQMTAHADLQF